MAYKRDIDLNALPPVLGKKEKPKKDLSVHNYSNKEIVDSVVDQLKNTLGPPIKEESKDYLFTKYNLIKDSKYYHYNLCGTLFWGMHEFTLKKVGEGCMCHTDFYVEFESLNNDNITYIKHVNSTKLKNYFKTEKEAWFAYKNIIKNDIKRKKESINRDEQNLILIENILNSEESYLGLTLDEVNLDV